MKFIKIILLSIVSLSLSQTSVFAGDYGNRSGLSIHLGSYGNGLQLNYTTPAKQKIGQYNKRYYSKYSSPSKSQYNHSQLGYSNKIKRYDNTQHYNTLKPNSGNKYQSHRQYNNGYNSHSTSPSQKYYKQQNRPQLGYSHNVKKSHHNTNRHYQQNRQDCRPVTQIVSNRYGHSERIAATLCYDRNGHSYLVQ